MAKKFLTPITFFTSNSDPVTGSSGQVYFNSASNKFRIYYNSIWNDVAFAASANFSASVDWNGVLNKSVGGVYNYSQTSSATLITASGSYPQTVISTTISGGGNPIMVSVYGDANYTGSGFNGRLQLYRGTTALGSECWIEADTANENQQFGITVIDAPGAGTFTYSLKVNGSSSNLSFGETQGPTIFAMEIGGVAGASGPGVPTGGTASQVLTKSSSVNYDTVWTPITGTGSISYNTSPTLAGTVSASNISLSGNLTASVGTASFGNASFYTDGNGISIKSSSADEGGQLNLYGGTSYSASAMQIDNYQGALRILHNNGNSVSMTVSSTTGSVTFSSSVSMPTISNGAGTMTVPTTTGRIPSVQFSRSTATVSTTSSVTWTQLTGLSAATLQANKTYEYEIVSFVDVSANVALNHLIVAPSSITAGTITAMLETNTTQISFIATTNTMTSGSNTIANTTAVNTAVQPGAHILKGFIIPSASGTFFYGGIKLGSATAATASAQLNSYMIVTEIA